MIPDGRTPPHVPLMGSFSGDYRIILPLGTVSISSEGQAKFKKPPVLQGALTGATLLHGPFY